jgi:hypothetical protein
MPKQTVELDQARLQSDRNVAAYARKKAKAQDAATSWQWGRRVSSQMPAASLSRLLSAISLGTSGVVKESISV